MQVNKTSLLFIALTILAISFIFASSANAQQVAPFIDQIQQSKLIDELSTEMKVAGGLTLMSFIPLIIISMTAFIRIVIVFSMLRLALGVQQTPPNIVIVTLSLFLTFFVMSPVISDVQQNALTPYLEEKIELSQAIENMLTPLQNFMIIQTREQDMAVILKVSGSKLPTSAQDVSIGNLIPAFMLSELTTAFKMAFVIFIPFLLVDLVVATVLMSLGMIMVPPITIALPLKVMLFVAIDGWSLLTESLISSFY